MKIAIVGATGNVAGRTLATLAAVAEARVVALVRHPLKLAASLRANPNVEVVEGVLADRAYVERATEGVDALLWLTPSTFAVDDYRAYTLALAANAAHAIRANGIARVVFVSSHGADRVGAGHVSFAGEVEALLAAAARHTLALRSAGFMENLLSSVESLNSGQLFGVLPPDKRYPLVATRDLGDVAAACLLDPSWSGHSIRGVHGPVDVSAREQADILSRVLGTSIRYQPIPAEALRDTFLKRGASASVAAAYYDMFTTFARADYQPTEPRTVETTTPTTLETFAREVLVR